MKWYTKISILPSKNYVQVCVGEINVFSSNVTCEILQVCEKI